MAFLFNWKQEPHGFLLLPFLSLSLSHQAAAVSYSEALQQEQVESWEERERQLKYGRDIERRKNRAPILV